MGPSRCAIPAWTYGTEHRHSHCSLSQIQSERRKSAPAAQQQADQQHSKVLNRQRHRRARYRNRDARAQCNEQAGAHHERNLPRGFENAFLLIAYGLNRQLLTWKTLQIFDAERQCSMSLDCRSRSTSLEVPSRAACAACKCRRKRMYRAIATHTTTSALQPRIRNHQIIRTTV